MRNIFVTNPDLILHSLTDDDLGFLRAFVSSRNIYRYEPTYLPELEDSPEKVLPKLRHMELERDRQCIWGIYEKSSPEKMIGLAELYDYKTSGLVISIGYRIAEEYWGRGIASSCVRGLLDFIMTETRVKMVTAHVIPENKGSARVLLKNGFEYLLTKEEDWGHEHLTTADVYTWDRPES